MEGWEKTREWLFNMEDTDIKIASHRGKFSSSVIENTSLAFLTAVGEGADMVEMDLDLTKDGILVGHHDKTMRRLFSVDGEISGYTWDEIQKMPLINYLGEINVTGLETFQEILDSLKGKTLIALDKCWDYWDEVYEVLAGKDMLGQAIFKFPVKNSRAAEWAERHGDCMFIPMVKEAEHLEAVDGLRKRAVVPAVEIVPRKESDSIYADSVFVWLKERHMKVWCNSLSLARRLVYGAGYDDLKSLALGGDEGWGVLAKKGVDIIQTDWPAEAAAYLSGIGRRGREGGHF